MRVSKSFGSYNFRRYGRPWIAKITAWPVGGKPELVWDGYVGDDNGGEVEMDALAGDIIRTGQKDNRGNGGTNDWWVVNADGTLSSIDAAEGRKLFGLGDVTAPTGLAAISDADLIAECRRRGLEVSNG